MSTDSPLSKGATIAMVAALVVAEVTASFETSMVFTSVKAILQEYGRPATVGWLLSSYLLIAAASAAVCSRLGDMFGRRNLLLLLLGCSFAGSLISAFAPTLEGVIFGRAVQGFAGAVLPLALGLIRQHVAPSRLNMSVAVVAASASLGSGLGIIVGGVIVDTIGWRHIFSASATLSAISFVAAFLAAPRSARVRSAERLDIVGGLLFVPAIAALLLGISTGHERGWDVLSWGLLAASAVLLTLWLFHELRQASPLIDVRLLAKRSIALTNIAGAIAAIGVLQFSQLVLLLLQQPLWTGAGLGLSATLAAMVKAPGNIITTAASPVWGYLSNRFGASRLIMGGMAVLTACCVLLIFEQDTLWAVVGIALIGTVAVSSAYAAFPMVLVRAAPLGRISETLGVSSVIRSVFMAVGSQGMLVVLATSTVSNPAFGAAEFPTAAAYKLMFGLLAATCIGTLLVAAIIPREDDASDDGAEPSKLPASSASEGSWRQAPAGH